MGLLHLLEIGENHDNHPALIWRTPLQQEDLQFSYYEVFSAAKTLAEKLEELGARANCHIAFTSFPEATYCLPPIVLGILKLGCTFVPLGQNRSHFSNFPVEWIIADKPESADGDKTELQILGHAVYILKVRKICASRTGDGSFAYAVTTSGTTGFPKRVQVPHQAIIPNIEYFRKRFEVKPIDIIFQAAPPTFDPFIVELFLAFSSRASLLMVPTRVKSTPAQLFSVLTKQKGPTIIQATPSLIKSLGTSRVQNLLGPGSQLRVLAFGGEPCPDLDLLRLWKDAANKTKIFSIYGVTEVSCWSTCFEIDVDTTDCISLGEPLPFNQLQVRSTKSGDVLSEGVGQLFLTTGDRMCTIDDKHLTNKWHPTGDLVELKKDSSIIFQGRISESKDFKRLGQKISLVEVENEASKLALVQNCTATTNILDELGVVLFVCSSSSSLSRAVVELEVLSQLQKVLPPLLVPDAVIAVRKIALTSHMKVNRGHLMSKAKKWLQRQKIKSLPPPRHTLERVVREAWIIALGVKNEVEIKEDTLFLVTGGDSAQATFLYGHLLVKLGLDESPQLLAAVLEKPFSQICDTLVDLVIASGTKRTSTEMLYYKDFETQNLEIGLNNISKATANPVSYTAARGCFKSYNHFELPKSSQMKISNFEEVWKVDFMKCIDASPLLVGFERSDPVVFVGSHSGKFAAINANTGDQLWTKRLPDRIESTAVLNQNGALIFLGCYDGCLYCLSSREGVILWTFQTGAMIKSSAVVCKETVIVGSYDQSVYCLSQETGSKIWSMNLNCGSILATPCLMEVNLLVVATLKGTLASLSAKDGTLAWKNQLEKPFFSSPLQLSSKKIVIGSVSGLLSFVDTSNGKTICTLKVEEGLFANIIKMDADKIIVAAKNELTCIDYNCHTLIWVVNLGGQITSTPFFSQNYLFATSLKKVFFIYLKNNSFECKFELPNDIFSSPVVHNNVMFLGCRDNYLYACKIYE